MEKEKKNLRNILNMGYVKKIDYSSYTIYGKRKNRIMYNPSEDKIHLRYKIRELQNNEETKMKQRETMRLKYHGME